MSYAIQARGTGRTQRMLDEALRSQRAGKRVLIVAANEMHRRELRRRAEAMGISFAAFGGCRLVSLATYAIDIMGLRVDRAFVDHYAEEVRHTDWVRSVVEALGRVLELALHRPKQSAPPMGEWMI